MNWFYEIPFFDLSDVQFTTVLFFSPTQQSMCNLGRVLVLTLGDF